jgi:hypothetical protein
MSGDRVLHPGETDRTSGVGLTEVIAVWCGFLLSLVAVCITYSWVAPEDLYHVSQSGVAGGAGRAFVYLNYPIAIVTVALLAVVYDRWCSCSRPEGETWGRAIPILSILAVACCLLIAVPGVVDQGDLDAKPINTVPALGVLFVAGSTILTLTRCGRGVAATWTGADQVRLVVTVVLAVISIPWYFAAFGVYTDDIPGLRHLFIAEVVPAGEEFAAVHLGAHHGLDGSLLAMAAIWLSRVLGRMWPTRLRGMLRGYLALMLAYGLGNFVNDAWQEQITKRGWTDWRVPSVTTPDLTIAWGVVVLGSILIALVLRRFDGERAARYSVREVRTA